MVECLPGMHEALGSISVQKRQWLVGLGRDGSTTKSDGLCLVSSSSQRGLTPKFCLSLTHTLSLSLNKQANKCKILKKEEGLKFLVKNIE